MAKHGYRTVGICSVAKCFSTFAFTDTGVFDHCEYEQDYYQLTGAVAKVDAYWKTLQVGNMSIGFYEITEIKIHEA